MEERNARVSVSTDDDEDKDWFEVGAEDDIEEDIDPRKPSRKERRRDRGDSLVEAANRRAEAAETAAAEQRAMIAGLTQRLTQVTAPQQQPQNQPDPRTQQLEQEFDDLERTRLANVTQYHQMQAAGTLDHATAERMQKEDRQLRDRIARNQHARFSTPQQYNGPTPQQLEAFSIQQRFKQDHSDVVSNRKAASYFQAAYVDLRETGAPEDWATIEKARVQGARARRPASEGRTAQAHLGPAAQVRRRRPRRRRRRIDRHDDEDDQGPQGAGGRALQLHQGPAEALPEVRERPRPQALVQKVRVSPSTALLALP